ncbi:hypothetical protein D4R52_01045 [bacterium]|nr:MAG: hypothetical protein D4R52_01045 [bacterium]
MITWFQQWLSAPASSAWGLEEGATRGETVVSLMVCFAVGAVIINLDHICNFIMEALIRVIEIVASGRFGEVRLITIIIFFILTSVAMVLQATYWHNPTLEMVFSHWAFLTVYIATLTISVPLLLIGWVIP